MGGGGGGGTAQEACSCNLECWELSRRLLEDTGKPRKSVSALPDCFL